MNSKEEQTNSEVT